MKKKTKKSDLIVEKHSLIPKHVLCSDKEKEQVLEKYAATIKEMPKILPTDRAIATLKAKPGDMVRIEREDSQTGKTFFYRVVSNE